MYNTPIATAPRVFDLTSLALLFVTFLTGIAGTLQMPTLSLFLTDEVHAHSGMVRFFFIGSAAVGILVSQFLAGRSDKRGDRKNLVAFCCMLGMLVCVLSTWNCNYFVLLFVEVLPSSSGSITNSQMLTLACEHADRTGRKAVIFSSILRTQASLAWVIGPPLAYALAMGLSSTVMYLSTVVAPVACGVMVWLSLPPMSKNVSLAAGAVEAPRRNRRNTLLLFVICTLMWGTNSLYIVNMPLFIINKLHLPKKLAGIMMGTATRLEIPAMLIASYFAKRLGKCLLIRIAVVARFFSHVGMLLTHSPVILLDLQLLNTTHIRVLGGIGMLYFRDLIPGRAGSATTLYTNTICVGQIIARLLAGIAAEIWNYHAVFWLALAMIVATVACLVRIGDA